MERIKKAILNIPYKKIDTWFEVGQHALFAFIILHQAYLLDVGNLANWGEREGLRFGMMTWAGIAWMHWCTGNKYRKQNHRIVDETLESRRKARDKERAYQAVLNILERMDKSTLDRHGIYIKKENEKAS